MAGGLTEFKRNIREKISDCTNEQICLLLIGTCVAALFAYSGYRLVKPIFDYRLSQRREYKITKLANATGQGTPECAICMENVATNIFVPCNHLMACMPCTVRLWDSPNR